MSAIGTRAVEAALRAAKTEAGRKAAQEGAAAIAKIVGKTGGRGYERWKGDRGQRALAHKLASQVHGQLSEAVFLDSPRTHLIVWKDDTPLAAFPPVDGDLAERTELRHVTADDRFDPTPTKRKRR